MVEAETIEAIDAPEERGPLRTCIATRAVRPVGEMLRFVIGPDDRVVADLKHKLPGRGVWVTATERSVREAVRRKVFARGFRRKGDVRVPDDLSEGIERMLEANALQALALANKAGVVVSGAAKVDAAIGAGAVGALVHARDGSADGARKIAQALHRRQREAPEEISRIEFFDSVQLSLALGRSNVIHAALRTSGACRAFLAQCRRLALYRTGDIDPARGIAADDEDMTGEAEQRLVGDEATNG